MAFNRFLQGGSSDVTDGSTNIIAASLTANNLDGSKALKTDGNRKLISTDLAIADTIGLQLSLDSKLGVPLAVDLDCGGNDILNTPSIKVTDVPATFSAELVYTGGSDIIVDLSNLGGGASFTSTGVTAGGVITINADPKKFDISDGTGIIYDTSTLTATEISWSGLTAQFGVYVGDQSFVSINSSGVPVLSATVLTNSETRDVIFLGQIIHLDQINVVAVLNEQSTILSTNNQLRDLFKAIGELNVRGNVMSSNSLLTLAKSEGVIISFGANYKNDINNPHFPTVIAIDTNLGGSNSFAYRYQDGSQSSQIVSALPLQYDDGNGQGSPGTVGANKWTVQRIFTFSVGGLIIQPGQFVYNSEGEAVAAINTEGFVLEPAVVETGVLIAFLAVRGNASDLSDSGTANFSQATKFGSGAAGSAGGILGPGVSTDTGIARWDGVSGNLLQDSIVAIDDVGVMTGVSRLEIDNTAAATGLKAITINMDAAGFVDNRAININYEPGSLSAGDNTESILINVDNPSSGTVKAITVTSAGGGIIAMDCGPGVAPIFQHGAGFQDADTLLNIAVDVTVALSSGGAGNITSFAANNDTFTIGSTSFYSALQFINNTAAGIEGVLPTFEYSSGPAAFTSFSPTDGTDQFRQSGSLIWNLFDIAGWVQDSNGEYRIRITRNRVSVSPPVFDIAQISSQNTYAWDANGIISVSEIQLYETGPAVGDVVKIRAPASLSGDYVLTLPVDDGLVGQVMTTDGSGILSWEDSGTGDVTGPGSSTLNAIAKYSDTSGKIIQNTGVTIDGGNNMTGVTTLNTRTISSFVDGPVSATNTAIPRFSGTTGKILQNSGITVDASNNVSGMGTLNSRTIANWVDGTTGVTDSRICVFSGTGGKLIKQTSTEIRIVSPDEIFGIGILGLTSTIWSRNISIGPMTQNRAWELPGDSGNAGDYLSTDGGVATVSTWQPLPLPINYVGGLKLIYVSHTVVNVLSGTARDSTDDVNIKLSGTTPVDIEVVGAGGLMTGESKTNNETYEIYLLHDSTGVLSDSAFLVPEGVTPSQTGYNRFRYLGAVRNSNGNDFIQFYMCGTGNFKTVMLYSTFSDLQVLSSGSGTGWANMSFGGDTTAALCPKGSGSVLLNVKFESDVTQNASIRFRPDQDTGDYIDCFVVQSGGTQSAGSTTLAQLWVPLGANRITDYEGSSSSLDNDVSVVGYCMEI